MPSKRPPIRLCLLVTLTLAALPSPVLAAGYDERDYWAFADRLQRDFDRLWNDDAGRYEDIQTMTNSDLLLTHSVAALRGHEGPARNDERARRLVRALLSSPPYVATPPPSDGDSQTHAPGWVGSMTELRSNQHVVIDAQVADALKFAWLARRRLGLSKNTAALIADHVHRVATSRFWRWPTVRLNQINWHAELYAADATVTGRARLLRHDLRLQLRRFLAEWPVNFGPGMHFHYVPQASAASRQNFDSPEYANIVASFTRFYAQARRAGMAPPRGGARRTLRQWLRRVLTGYWTHGGYMNWDSGLGFRRWHQSKKLGLSQQALIGIATAPSLAIDRQGPAWAKWMLDRGFDFYAREAERAGGVAPGLFFGVNVIPQDRHNARIGAGRMQANAARAVAAGLGRMRAVKPPPLYAYDPDNARLAVTTPAYNTAIVAANRGAFPYGGIEIARLFDGRQEVAAGIGGAPPNSFGVVVRDLAGHRVLATQRPRTSRERSGVPPLRLTRAPSGVGAQPWARTNRAYAGPFHDLRATGTARSATLAARTRHRFTAAFISSSWSVRRVAGRRRYTVDLLFPSWGRRAVVDAVLRDGTTRRVGAQRLSLSRIAYLHVRSRFSGYVIVPRGRRPAAELRLLDTARQSSSPHPGPTLAIRLADRARFGRLHMTARLAPTPNGQDPAAVAARLDAQR